MATFADVFAAFQFDIASLGIVLAYHAIDEREEGRHGGDLFKEAVTNGMKRTAGTAWNEMVAQPRPIGIALKNHRFDTARSKRAAPPTHDELPPVWMAFWVRNLRNGGDSPWVSVF